MATQDISQLVVEVKSQGIQTAANQLDKLATASDKAEAAVKKLGTAVVGVNSTLTGGVANAAALVSSISALTAVMERMTQTQQRAASSIRGNNEAMAEAHALARGLSGSLGALWVTYGNLAGMGVGIAIGASLKGVVSVGKEVEQTLEQIRVLGGATTDEISKMSTAISQIGQGTQGPKEVAEALQVLTLAGLNAQQAMEGVQASLNLSVAGGVSVEKSAETLVQVGTALGYTAKDFDHVADVIAKTAAVSMSSVDSISNAFKSAAAVGEVYGASLQDIALGLAAVANLGIQGTSAGTALKNMYKDLSASTEKVTGTLKAMKMSIADFRDANGFFLPLFEVVKKLDEGFGRLNQQQKKIAEVKMFSQQGAREYAVLTKLLHTAADDTEQFGSKLEEMYVKINQAAAFSTTAAIAMSQTTSNQLKSVGNTLQTVFADTFRSVAPQIGELARTLKAAFNSEAFRSTLAGIANAVSALTKVLVEHAGTIGMVAAAYAGLKVVEFAAGMVSAAKAFDIAAVSARGFLGALGPIGLAIAGLTLAWQVYKEMKDKALDNKPAENNLQEYADRIREAASKEKAILELKKKGYSDAKIAQENQMKEDAEASDRAINDALAGVEKLRQAKEKMWASLSENDKRRANMMAGASTEALDKEAARNSTLRDSIEYVKAEKAYQESLARTSKLVASIKTDTKDLVDSRTALSAMADAKAQERPLSTGEGMLPVKGNKAGENAAYAADIKAYEDQIKKAYQELSNFKELQNQAFRQGEIGKMELINSTADAEAKAYEKVVEAANSAKAKAAKTENKDADVQRFVGIAERAGEEALQADRMREAQRLTMQREALAQGTALKIKALEDEGKFVDAANLKWTTDGKVALEQAQKDLEKYGDKFPWLIDLVNQYAATRDAAINSAQLKEDTLAFNTALLDVQATLKGFKSDTFGSSISGIMDKAEEATKRFSVAMAEAKKKRDALGKDAATGKPEAVKAYAEANKELLSVADKQKAMWKEVGQTITESLGSAFGSAGTALGKLNESMIEYANTENATAEDRMGQYANMAQAASGFFDKQSKGYKLLNGISQAFHIAEMARTVVMTTMKIAQGAATFFAQSGWGGFAGIAAMGAVMAGLGFAMSGNTNAGGQSAEEVQKTQGTGGVFGDNTKKSESIMKSLEAMKSNSNVLLPINQGMLEALRNIEASMTGLTNLVIRSPGITNGTNMGIKTGTLASGETGLLGVSVGITKALGQAIPVVGGIIGSIMSKVSSLWGSTKQTIIDSGLQFGGRVSDLQSGSGFNQYASVDTTKKSMFGLKKSTTNSVQTQGVSNELAQQFGLVFSNLEDALKIAATGLGKSSVEVGNAINNMVLESTKVSLKDLKGEDLTEALNAVLSKAMDDIAMKAFPAMDAFRQVGEGYAQTVMRVAAASEQANLAMEQLGLKAVDYTQVLNKQGDVAVEIAKQTIAMAEGNSGVNDMLKGLGSSLDDLVNTYKSLVDIRKQLNAVGLQGSKLDVNLVKGAGSIQKLGNALSTYQDKYFTDQEKSAIMLKSVTAEFNALGFALPANKAALRALIEQTGMNTAENAKLTGQLLSLAEAYDKATSAADDARKTQIDSTNQTIDGLKKFLDTLKAFRDSLALGSSSILTPTEKYLEAKRQYEDTVAKAMAGDKTAQENFTGVAQAFLDASRVINASSQGYTDSYNQVQSDIARLASSTATQLSNAELQLKTLNDQLMSLNTLNATAANIEQGINNLVMASPLLATSSTPVVVDTAALQAQIADLQAQLAQANEANAKQMDTLMAVVYNSQTEGATLVADAVTTTGTNTVWANKIGSLLDNER